MNDWFGQGVSWLLHEIDTNPKADWVLILPAPTPQSSFLHSILNLIILTGILINFHMTPIHQHQQNDHWWSSSQGCETRGMDHLPIADSAASLFSGFLSQIISIFLSQIISIFLSQIISMAMIGFVLVGCCAAAANGLQLQLHLHLPRKLYPSLLEVN